MFKLALANASRHVLLRSKVLEEVVCFYNGNINITRYFALPNSKLQGRGIVCKF